MQSKQIVLDGNLCYDVWHEFNPYVRVSGKERISLNSILFDIITGSELLESNDSTWRETLDTFQITIERLY